MEKEARPFKIAPTVESRDALGVEDYRKKSCIPILFMFWISKNYLASRKWRQIASLSKNPEFDIFGAFCGL